MSALAALPLSLAVHGTATAQLVTVAPTELEFPATSYGEPSEPLTVTVTSADTVPRQLYVYITQIACVGFSCPYVPGWYSDFSVMSHCPAVLQPGASCTVDVTFTPHGPGHRRSQLTVYPSLLFDVPQVRLSGIGIGSPPIPTPLAEPRVIPASGIASIAILAAAILLLALACGFPRRQRHPLGEQKQGWRQGQDK